MKDRKAVGGVRRFIYILFIFRYVFLFNHSALTLHKSSLVLLSFYKGSYSTARGKDEAGNMLYRKIFSLCNVALMSDYSLSLN